MALDRDLADLIVLQLVTRLIEQEHRGVLYGVAYRHRLARNSGLFVHEIPANITRFSCAKAVHQNTTWRETSLIQLDIPRRKGFTTQHKQTELGEQITLAPEYVVK